jgi:hypothetical protein
MRECRQADTPDTESGAQEDEEAICRLILLSGKTLLLWLGMSLRIHPRNTMHTSAKVPQKEREKKRDGKLIWKKQSNKRRDRKKSRGVSRWSEAVLILLFIERRVSFCV